MCEFPNVCSNINCAQNKKVRELSFLTFLLKLKNSNQGNIDKIFPGSLADFDS